MLHFRLILGGLGICLIPFTRDLYTLSAAVLIFSFGSAGFYATINCILIDQFGKENVSESWGFIRMQEGILNFLYLPILGKIYRHVHSCEDDINMFDIIVMKNTRY